MQKLLATGIGIVVIAAGVLTAVNYQQWFVYPGLRMHATAQASDPASVQFRGESISADGWLCGEMNAKNGYGAYAGFKRFISRSENEAYIEGVGFAGKGGQQHVQLVDDLLHQSKALIMVKKLIEDGATSLSNEAEWQRLVDKLKFEERWKASCT